MVVQHNISAMNANRYYGINNKALAGSLEKLSSGYAINKAGDNAAGLAVSEKMRAQIGGLTQASKNAEDGISMVQTFEGALQETDSILQRMRTLATQSANGSYQDDVDREAMQLEFDQLNDELNQIADTDFNGVVMLNGGQMADGLKAVDGKFDYANSSRVAKQLGTQDIHGFSQEAMDNKNANVSAITDGDGTSHSANTVSAADALWSDLGFDRLDGKTTNDGPESVDVTFKYDSSTQTWAVDSATGGISADSLKNLYVNTSANKNNGGFQVSSKSNVASAATLNEKNALANVVVDQDSLVNGDTITIRFSNPTVSNTAAENIAVTNSDTSRLTNGTGTAAPDTTTDLQVEVVNTKIESTNIASPSTDMSKDIDSFFGVLDGAKVTVNYADATANAGKLIAEGTTQSVSLSYKDPSNGSTVNITLDATHQKKEFTIGNTKFVADGGTSDGTITIGLADASSKSAAPVIDSNGKLVEFTVAKNATDAADNSGKGSSGSVTYTLSNAASKYSEAANPGAEVLSPKGEVSKSNAYEQSKATMTYTNHLSLQVGARTKDQVDFTFKYDSNGLGDLKANMNCSARTDGLGTADLSIADQKSANNAIDKIDNALNKVNMVRATFGAAQNRLEHKINNIDTNTENLTAAESRIRDTQMDKEMMKFTSSQILSQASQSMLAQANSLPQGVLQLLG